MGQFVSASRNNCTCNDDLVNFLVNGGYIISKEVERVLRSVDRGFYFSNEEKLHAYNDVAHHSDEIHLSAPAVYATVLECLKLQSGHKFLNVGSGVGYFSTAVGLMLGINGVNHGIEINKLLVDRAYQKVEEFKLHAAAVDYFNFCEPVFIHGNACDLLPNGYYDRVYCGAGVPSEEAEFMKSLINIGGILVMPLEGSLMKITRKTEHTWRSEEIFEVVFTELVVPEKCSVNTVSFPTVEPSSLQELCKLNIRTTLRENLEKTQPNLLIRTHYHLKTTTGSTKRNIIDNYVCLHNRVPGHQQLIHLRDFANSLLGTRHEVHSDISSSSSDIDADEINLRRLDDNFYEAVREAEARATAAAEARVIAAAEALAAAEARIAAAHSAQFSPRESTSDDESSTSADESTKRKSQDCAESSEPNTARAVVMHLAQCSHHESTSVDESSTSADESTKRKSQDYAEGSEPNTASAATKNSKRIKMDSASQNSESEPSASSEYGSNSWTTLSTDSGGLVSVDDSGDDDVEGHSADDVEGHSADDVQGHGADDVEGHGADDAEGHGADDVEGHGADDVEGHGEDDVEGHSEDDVEGHSEDGAEGHGEDDAEGHSEDDVEGHSEDGAEGHSEDDAEGHSEDDAEGHSEDDAEGHSEDDAEGHSEDDFEARSENDLDDDDYYVDEDDSDDYVNYVDTNLSRAVNSYLCHGRTEMNENERYLTDEELMAYRFATDRKENEFSKLLKVEIDSLPIPNPLKLYLNYNRID